MKAIERLLPEPDIRRVVLASFAESIRAADLVTSGVWRVSVHKTGRVWLNVSRWAMAGILPRSMWITVQDLALGDNLKQELYQLRWVEPSWYRIPSKLLWITMPASSVKETYERCKAAHLAALRDVANYQRVKHKMRFHSAEFVDYLREAQGLEIPDPDI